MGVLGHAVVITEIWLKHRKLHWFHWLVISLSLVLTVGAWYISKQQIEEKTRIQFNREASQVIALVKERMAKYEQALWAGVAAIHSQSHGIDYAEWVRFSEALKICLLYTSPSPRDPE